MSRGTPSPFSERQALSNLISLFDIFTSKTLTLKKLHYSLVNMEMMRIISRSISTLPSGGSGCKDLFFFSFLHFSLYTCKSASR